MPRWNQTEEERFAAKVIVDAYSECWVWTASKLHGYGRFKVNGTFCQAHRWSYEHHIGPIPDGLTLDHLCRNRACVNPEHLEPVTGRENTLRGTGPTAQNAIKTHCKRGHALEGANLIHDGGRRCRKCARQIWAKSQRKRYAQRRAET